jgi:hypothetical protein
VLAIPGFIEEAGVLNSRDPDDWDDGEVPLWMYTEDERLAHRIDKTCGRGVAGLSAGFAEWIAWRFSKDCDDPVLFHYIEAVWAAVVDWHYIRPVDDVAETPLPEVWKGPVRGPLCTAFNLLEEIVRGRAHSSSAYLTSSCLSKLASHVLPDPEPYKVWRRQAIRRLSVLYPRNEDDELDPPIPRAALDTRIPYTPASADDLIRDYLHGLDFRENPFLSRPEEMVRNGFQGTPYEY